MYWTKNISSFGTVCLFTHMFKIFTDKYSKLLWYCANKLAFC